MKKSILISIIFITAAIFLLINASGDLTTYSNFEEAKSKGKVVKLVGQLAKDQEIYYDAAKDPNYLSFYVTDQKGATNKVVLKAAKPQDFELSEQIVITGKMENDIFVAQDILLKCPSKYKDEEVYVKSES